MGGEIRKTVILDAVCWTVWGGGVVRGLDFE